MDLDLHRGRRRALEREAEAHEQRGECRERRGADGLGPTRAVGSDTKRGARCESTDDEGEPRRIRWFRRRDEPRKRHHVAEALPRERAQTRRLAHERLAVPAAAGRHAGDVEQKQRGKREQRHEPELERCPPPHPRGPTHATAAGRGASKPKTFE